AKADRVARVDLEGKSLARWRREVEQGNPLPLPPRVPVEGLFRNPGPNLLSVRFRCALDLRGPGGRRRSPAPSAYRGPTNSTRLSVPAGGAVPFRLERLWGDDQYLYPVAPGGYSLTVHLLVRVREEVPGARWRAVTLQAGPIALRVEDVP